MEISRISPEVQPSKISNLVKRERGGGYLIQRIKYLIVLQTILGINRLHLFGYRKCVLRFVYTYNTFVVISCFTSLCIIPLYKATYVLYKFIITIQYLLLAVNAMFLQRGELKSFFSMLQVFDEKLNICDDVNLIAPMHYYILGIGAIFSYTLFEYVLYVVEQLCKFCASYSTYVMFLTVLVYDMEIILLCVLLVMVSRRLRLIKLHVAKAFSMNIYNEKCEDLNKLKSLSEKINLDISSLHKVYNLLHKCSEELNSVMNIPMTIILLTAGLTTITILKNLNYMIRLGPTEDFDASTLRVVSGLAAARCLKYIIHLMFLCHFSNATKTQVDCIRTMIHDMLSINQLDKIERRKLKAFGQLCCDNAFLYKLWGVVRIDMSLPLSYSSLCITYLIILLQFSKIID